MLSSLYSPSSRRGRSLWRVFRHPLLPVLLLLTTATVYAADRHVDRRVAPEYPVLAKRMKIGGTVKVVASVAADGSVSAAKADHGNAILVPAAEEAVRKWKFAAADGPTTEVVTVEFELDN